MLPSKTDARRVSYDPRDRLQNKADRTINGETLTQGIYGDFTTPKVGVLVGPRNMETNLRDEPRSENDDGKTGRVVPYHPKDWNKGNSVFNEFFDKDALK